MGVLLVVTAVLVGAWLYADRQNELFCLSFKDGALKLVRGRVPGALARDLRDALVQMKVSSATLIARRDATAARLAVRGIDDFYAQRLRNIFQLYPMSSLLSAPSPVHGAAWRMLGIGWLVWAFSRRDDDFS